MKKKLLLVSANQMKVPYPVYPLALAYLSAYLKKALPELEIRLFDFIDKDYEAYRKELRSFQPNYTGISLRNIDDVNSYVQESFIAHYKNIVGVTKEESKSVIILGGAGYSVYPELMFREIQPDFGIYGEGELHFTQLLTALESGSDYANIQNLLFLRNNNLVFNKGTQNSNEISLCFDDTMLDYYWQYSGMLNIQTKRGCPYNCVYCTYPLIESHKVRCLNIDSIIDAISYLYRENKMDYFFFTDSVFNINNDYNYELAERIINSGIPIKWGAYFNFCNIDEKFLRLMKRAGLKHIEFGTDSLSDTMLENYQKPFHFSDILQISNICEKLEIDNAHFLILAGNGETEETLNEGFSNARLLNRTVFFPFTGLRIYPNTALQKLAINENRIEKNNDLLLPNYYISEHVDTATLKEKASNTGKRWIFSDDDLSAIMSKMRARNKKGPLWEYLIQ